MFTWIQKHQQTLLIIILVIVVIAFVWLYNPINDPRQLSQNEAGQLYGRPVTIDQFRAHTRLLEVAYTLDLFDLVTSLAGRGLFSGDRLAQEQAQRQFAWNLMVLREEADRLGLNPTPDELREKVLSLSTFQTPEGQYSEGLRAQYVEQQLGPRGFNWAQAEQLVADGLRLEQLQKLLDATAIIDPVQARQYYEFLNRQTLVKVARMNTPDLVGDLEVTDEEIEAYYAGNKAGFLSEPKVALSYVKIPLPEPETAAEAETDADADADAAPAEESQVDLEKLQAVRDLAQNFAVDLYKGNTEFAALAEKFELEVQTTEVFEVGNAPEPLSGIPQVHRSIRSLTEEVPFSDVLATDEAYYVLHLNKFIAPEQLPMEAVRDQIVRVLEAEKREERTLQRSAELKAELEAALAAGKEFEPTATELGFAVNTLDPFTLSDPPGNVANIGTILQAASRVPAEKVSDWQPVPGGGIFVYVAQREAAPTEDWDAERTQVKQSLEMDMQRQMLSKWFETRLRDANFESTIQG